MTSLQLGLDERNSAKKRRQEEYRQELQLQMRERDAARAREKLQDMSVNASGYLDPEKGPDRLKGLGGGEFSPRKTARDVKVRPYHTLFLYDRDEEQKQRVMRPASRNMMVDSTYATGALGMPGSQDQAYHFYATRDITQPAPSGNIVQPLAPITDNRPIIVINRGSSGGGGQPKYNPFQNDNGMRDFRDLLSRSQLDNDKWRLRLQNQTDADKRRLQLDLEEEQRRLRDREAEAKRRMDELRREAEERRKEAERRRLELERLKLIREAPATKVVPTHRPYSRTKLMDDMDEYSKRLREERWRVEEMLRNLKNVPPAKDTLIIQRQRKIPPTPKTADLANRQNVQIFTELKHKDNESRDQFRTMFPDVPYTNMNLETQQDALLKQQESLLRHLKTSKKDDQEHLRWRPHWMYHNGASPFPERSIHTSRSLDLELERVGVHSSSRRMKRIDYSDDFYDSLHLRSHRPSSRDTLDDDTWLRPSSSDI